MKKLLLLVFCSCLFLWLLPSGAFSTDSNLSVNFIHDGKKYMIQGEHKNDVTYLFNKGAKKKINIVTLNWGPYISEKMCKQGWVQQFTIALLASQGYEITSSFYPWARAVATVEHGVADILYPEWYIESTAPSDVFKGNKRRDSLALSDRFPGGLIAFMKRKGEKDIYQGDFSNLKGERICVVRDYQNTPEFDRLMDKGVFNIKIVNNDFKQAQLLWKKRVDFLINDPLAVIFAVKQADIPEQEKNEILNSIEIVKPIIQYNYLYFAVSKKKTDWQLTLDMLNKGIQDFESSGLIFQIIKNTMEECNINMDSIFIPYQEVCR
ncbi:MAG: amino acid ABC transporter substrate-binding protein [Desulfobacteraceae bacterium]|nr:amino acid ABC transporter substrate-binding protein [Desulfobacteraceae bacterium]